MKNAIIYYSLDGNCKYVADNLAKELGPDTDIFCLEPVKPYPNQGFMKMLVGGFAAMLGKKPPIKALKFDAREYDQIILGTPVWASTFAPPLRTFFMNNYIMDKPIALYACSSGGNAESTFKKLKDALEGCKINENHLSLVDPYTKKKDEDLVAIQEFAADLLT